MLCSYRESLVFVTMPHDCYVDDDGFRIKPNIAELRQYTNYMLQLFDRLSIHHYVIDDFRLEDRCKFVIKSIGHTHND